jgi:hypothetical protein
MQYEYILDYQEQSPDVTSNKLHLLSNRGYNGFWQDTKSRIDKGRMSPGDYERAGIYIRRPQIVKLFRYCWEFNKTPVMTYSKGKLTFRGDKQSFTLNVNALGLHSMELEDGARVIFAKKLMEQRGLLPSIKRVN